MPYGPYTLPPQPCEDSHNPQPLPYPCLPSIGGGTTVQVSGSGFSLVPDANVVYMTVPVSSTLLNGVIACDVVSATPTLLTCITRAYLVTDASAEDPNALNVQVG